MPTKNNTLSIKQQASDLAASLGSYHITSPIEDPFIAVKNMAGQLIFESEPQDPKYAESNKMEIPRYKLRDGDWQENLAIQNIQARLRMVTAYYLAQILPLYRWNHNVYNDEQWFAFFTAKQKAIQDSKKEGVPDEETPFYKTLKQENPELAKIQERIFSERPRVAFLLVLASSNADEALRGFYTKYDASSADINPVGSYSKTHLRQFLRWCIAKFANQTPNFQVIGSILDVTASPELTPTDEKGAVQDDEIDIELTYGDLYELGLLRKRDNLGPLSIFQHLCKDKLGKVITYVNKQKKVKELRVATPTLLADKVSTFFTWYGKTRSKMTILTPSIHATNYSPDDNRYDHRPFLYPWFPESYQIKQVISLAKEMERREDVQELIKKGNVELSVKMEEQGRQEQVAAPDWRAQKMEEGNTVLQKATQSRAALLAELPKVKEGGRLTRKESKQRKGRRGTRKYLY